MNKQKFFNLLYVVLIIGVILFMIWIVFWLKGESYECMKDPITYYTEKIGEQCICSRGGMFNFGGSG